jgi:hypothetical protein
MKTKLVAATAVALFAAAPLAYAFDDDDPTIVDENDTTGSIIVKKHEPTVVIEKQRPTVIIKKRQPDVIIHQNSDDVDTYEEE